MSATLYGLPVTTVVGAVQRVDPMTLLVARAALTRLAVHEPDEHARFKAAAAAHGLTPLDLMAAVSAAEDQR